jgi:hypothetical protein
MASSMNVGGTVGVEGAGGQVWVLSACASWARIYMWSTKAMSRLRSIAISKGKVPVEITYLADILRGCGHKQRWGGRCGCYECTASTRAIRHIRGSWVDLGAMMLRVILKTRRMHTERLRPLDCAIKSMHRIF